MSRNYDYAWQKLSRQVRAERPVCEVDGCMAPSTSTDHIVPLSEAPHLRLVRSNLRATCHLHNEGRVTRRRQLRARVLTSPAVVREW